MLVVSVNVRFGGSNVALRAERIARNVRAKVSPHFANALFFVQECSASAMRAIIRVIGETHRGYAPKEYKTQIGPFVATFVPRGADVAVSWHRTPGTTMRRDYNAAWVRGSETKVYNVHLDSCGHNAHVRAAQIEQIARRAHRFAMLGDLNERAKHVSRGVDVRTVRTWRVRGTDHKARLYHVLID